MNRKLDKLYQYPFTRLKALLADTPCNTGQSEISLAIGEPQHAPPEAAVAALIAGLNNLNKYPATQGSEALRESISRWLCQRYQLPSNAIDPQSMVLPVQGTREALFAIAQVLVDKPTAPSTEPPLVIIPSPFYQIYEGAAIMAGAEPLYLPCTDATDYLPDLDAVSDQQWCRCQMIYICNPSNPTGALPSQDFYRRLLVLSERFDFIILSDECYSEIYFDEGSPPAGLLQAAYALGNHVFARCLVFNSLSKRSNLAGLRSGFVAGAKDLIKAFLLYRTYHGSAMPAHHQAASVAAWDDEAHVIKNRILYREKFSTIVPLLQTSLQVGIPPAGFCLWAKTPIDDERLTQLLFQQQHVRVLPGQYLARTVDGYNPGQDYLRIALVQPLAVCVDAAERISHCIEQLS